MKQTILITLKDDIIISANATSTGTHHTLDYLPGSVFLGIAAARLYADLASPAEAWQIFHSGQVTFHNAYIVSPNGEPTWASPLSWHHYKNEPIGSNQILQAQQIIRPGSLDVDPEPGRQIKQLRQSYVTTSGQLVEVKKTASMKTAIDAATGHAAEAQLFGYQALQSGQHFLGCLEIDDKIEQPLQDKLVNALCGSARIGRSRSAQYGRVNIQLLPDAKVFANPETNNVSQNTTELTFWCLSDLALTDQTTGLPILLPQPHHFGLTSGQLDLNYSFIRSRVYDSFNAYRKAFDSRREVIAQGSVITFTDLTDLATDLPQRFTKSLGSHTEIGLGRIALQAQACSKQRLQFHKAKKWINFESYVTKPKQIAMISESPFIIWLRQQTSSAQNNLDIGAWQKATIEKIGMFYGNARAFNAIDPEQSIGPSKSQWGNVSEAARSFRTDSQMLFNSLFEDKNTAICRERAGSENTWSLMDGSSTLSHKLSIWLTSSLDSAGKLIDTGKPQDVQRDVQFCHRVASLAAEMRNNNELGTNLSTEEQ